MKKVETVNITGSQDAPFVKETFDHYNEAIADTTSNIVKNIINGYTTNDIIVLHGCVVTATIPGTSSITAGAVYYNGEIYEVDANASLVTTGLQTLVWEIVTTYRANDPLMWSDGVPRDLHQINKMRLVAGLSGSGIANYNAATVKNTSTYVQTTTAATTVIAGSATIASESYKFMYTKANKCIHLTFLASITTILGDDVDKILMPLPSGITKDTAGASSGYMWYGHASYAAPGATTDFVNLQVSSYDDGSEGQRLKLTRVEQDDEITVSAATTITIKGHITMFIQ